MGVCKEIPVIDLFAGPGGLGEGFSAFRGPGGVRAFRTRLSIEMDHHSHQTLMLRSFFRQFDDGEAPPAYYEYLRGEERWIGASVEDLLDEFPDQGQRAREEAWCEELRPEVADLVDERVSMALRKPRKRKDWVLIGGPPCQAYSLVGRARMRGPQGDSFYEDGRHTLYREYLRIIAEHRPSVFVMENVKGLLSATSKNGDLVFRQILRDLERPPGSGLRYRLFPLSHDTDGLFDAASDCADPRDFIVKCEDHGVPQARHRVIIVGVLESKFGAGIQMPHFLPSVETPVSCDTAIETLPRLRSGLSRQPDSVDKWFQVLHAIPRERWFRRIQSNGQYDVAERIRTTVSELHAPQKGRGGQFIATNRIPKFEADWFFDPQLGGVCNHETRGHRADDLHRYIYVSCFGKTRRASPKLEDFPVDLLPQHQNVARALKSGVFNDRFHVQLKGTPSRTITSHISKDGHAFIHYDPTQCRSLTVREAARFQTFPDNYFFEGPRTEQYRQVGNAVPPLLAREVASIVAQGLANGWK